MKNTKKNTVNIETAAARLWGKGFTEFAKDSEKNKIARRIITENMATDGHLIIRTPGEFSAAPLLPWSDFTEGGKINAVIKPIIKENTILIPSAIYGHMAVNMGDDRDGDFFNIAIGGHWCAFTASGDGKFMDEHWSVQDGAEMAGNYRAFSAAFSSIEVKNIFTRFKVSAVRISEESGALGFRCLHFDVVYKGENFEIVLLNRRAEDSTREALDLVMSWAAEDESSAPAPVEAIAKAPAKKIAAMSVPKCENSDENGENTEESAENCENSTKNGVKIEKNADFGTIEIYFKEKPSQVVREALKTARFRWHAVKKCWYGKPENAKNVMTTSSEARAVLHAILSAFKAENVAGGAEVLPKGKTAPKRAESGENVKTSAADAEKIANTLTSAPEAEYLSKSSLPDHWRKVWRDAGIKGITVRNHRGGYSYHFTFTFRMIPGDVMPEAEALTVLENEFRTDPRFWGDWINDPDMSDECRGNVYYTAFYDWDAEKKERFFKDAARRTYEKMVKNGPGCVVHAWVFYLEREKMRREYPIFTAQFWDRLEVIAHSISLHNYDNSDAMTDYFDVGFYESWDFEPVKEGAKADVAMAEKMHAVAEVFRAKEEAAKKDEEEKREAERAEYIEKCKKQEAHAREVIAAYTEAMPADPFGPRVRVLWSELGALHDGSVEAAGDAGEAGAVIYSPAAFDAICADLGDYFREECGYYKTKFEFIDGEFHFTDRADIGDGCRSVSEMLRGHVEYIDAHPGEGYMLNGGATPREEETREAWRRWDAATTCDAGAIIEALGGLEA